MKEQDLIDLGFKKVGVTAEESGYEKEWYYYTYDLTTSNYPLSLVSDDNEEAKQNGWSVTFLDFEEQDIKDLDKLRSVIELFKKLQE